MAGLAVHDDRLTARVGALVLVLLAAAIVFVVAVLNRIEWRAGVTVRVYFGQVSALGEGAQIVIAGRSIGEITSIVLVPAHTTGPDHPLAGQGGIMALARIEKRYIDMVPFNGEFFVSSKSIFAPRWLEVGPPAKGAVPCRAVIEGDEVRG